MVQFRCAYRAESPLALRSRPCPSHLPRFAKRCEASDRGRSLLMSQRQLVALARTLIRGPLMEAEIQEELGIVLTVRAGDSTSS